MTGNNDTQVQQLGDRVQRRAPAQQWYDWIYKRVAENVPYDKLVAGIVTGRQPQAGPELRRVLPRDEPRLRAQGTPPTTPTAPDMPYYWARAEPAQARGEGLGFAYTFLGVRIECAQCHKHPFDQWTQDDFKEFTAFFTGTIRSTQYKRRRSRRRRRTTDASQGAGPREHQAGGNQLQRRSSEQPRQEGQGRPVPGGLRRRSPPGRSQADEREEAGERADRAITPEVLGGDGSISTSSTTRASR